MFLPLKQVLSVKSSSTGRDGRLLFSFELRLVLRGLHPGSTSRVVLPFRLYGSKPPAFFGGPAAVAGKSLRIPALGSGRRSVEPRHLRRSRRTSPGPTGTKPCRAASASAAPRLLGRRRSRRVFGERDVVLWSSQMGGSWWLVFFRGSLQKWGVKPSCFSLKPPTKGCP